MRALRTSIGVLGIAALGLGAGTVLVPGLAARLDVGAAVANDYLFVVPLGLAAAVVVVGALASRGLRGVDQATPPDPEGVPTADAPGADFDRLVGGGLRTAPATYRNRDRLRTRLREAALRSVSRAERCPRADARRRVAAGTWTDDPVAAAFLAEDTERDRASPREALAALRRGEVALQRRARRTVRAIERVGGGDPT